VILVPALLLGLVLGILVLLPNTDARAPHGDCEAAGSARARARAPGALPPEGVAGYAGDQLAHAAAIIDAGEALGVSAHGQAIGVMTAMGESGLQVLDRGDRAGPDSRGLFQQRANGAWGTYEDRMDPATSAASFFRALLKVRGWETLAPSRAAHRVQSNADPYHYERYWADAVAVTTAVSDLDPAETASLGSCAPGVPAVSAAGDDLPWPNAPVNAPSPLGMYNRECVDFALYRLNAMAGADNPPWKYHNSDLALGNAENWINVWHREGWKVSRTPAVGAVAYYAPGVGGAGPLGHVAIVSDIAADGTVTIEEYNGQPAPNDHRYGTRVSQPADTTAYLHFPG
jgi:surface antigen